MFISASQLQSFANAAARSFEEGLTFILVSQLVVYFTDIGYHPETNDCPMDFCEVRANMISGLKKKRFCDSCSSRIQNNELQESLDALLRWSSN